MLNADQRSYQQQISEAASLRAYHDNPQASLDGSQCISIETRNDDELELLDYINNHYFQFLRYVKQMDYYSQELLLSYFLIGKSQEQLAKIQGTTQTLTSRALHCAVRAALAIMLFGGPPSSDTITAILARHTITHAELKTRNHKLKTFSVPRILNAYLRLKNTRAVAQAFDLHPPEVRRVIKKTAMMLRATTGQKEKALSWWLMSLLNVKSKPYSTISYSDKSPLGKFRIPITKHTKLFHSRAAVEHILIRNI